MTVGELRVVAVAHDLPPRNLPQATQIGRLLENLDCAVTAFTSYSRSIDSQSKDEPAANKRPVSIRVRDIAPTQNRPFQLLTRFCPLVLQVPDPHRFWANTVVRRLRQAANSDDHGANVLVTFGMPMSSHLVGLRSKEFGGPPWIAHFSDPWVANPFNRYGRLVERVNSQLEKKVLTAADRIVVTSDETRDLFLERHCCDVEDRMIVLPHSFEPDLYPFTPNRSGRLVVRHLGSFYGIRTPEPLVAALATLLQRRPELRARVRFELIGECSSRFLFLPSEYGVPDEVLRFVRPVLYQKSLELMDSADLLLIVDAAATRSVFLPSKLVDYLGSGTPIAGITPPGAAHDLIVRLGGFTANPMDHEATVDLLIRSIDNAEMLRDSRNQGAKWGQESVRSEYDAKLIGRRFDKVIGEVVSP